MNKDIFDTLGPEKTHKLFDLLHQRERASRVDPLEEKWRAFRQVMEHKQQKFMCKHSLRPTHLLLGHEERHLLQAYVSRYVPMRDDPHGINHPPTFEGFKVRWLMEESAVEVAYIVPE